ncbi:hypothetical protein P3X46_014840 [Hevea brasiliensis]|uniref:Uncharacterized protein n=1 Tax=Hevea brasiliensis TaxID=3981 RepID=A0ABQ9LU35_HEVBR|nr:uncharacterized protein LOC110644720 [Hevea brasiliensis]KAJ9171476.1 hypothetical protein P3X46_014840 [Hevea brasiliensis]
MELKGSLQALIERAGALQDGLSDEIRDCYSFCRLCSENGRLCHIAETSVQERERLIAIRDSLREVGDVLMLLQRLRSWQIIDTHAALNRLEESRIILIEKVKQFPGRSLDVVKELNAWFNNGKITDFDLNWNGEIKNKADSNIHNNKEKGTRSRFVSFCIGILFGPCNWQKAIGVAAKLVVVSASISSTVRLCHARKQQYCSSFVESAAAPIKQTVPSLTDRHLDVFYGRG